MELIYFSYFGCKFKIRTNAMHEHVINNHEHVNNAFKHIKNIQVYSKNFNNQLACLFLKLKNIYIYKNKFMEENIPACKIYSVEDEANGGPKEGGSAHLFS